MKTWGIVMVVLGLALAVYSYGTGIVPFIAGLVAVGLGSWLIIRERRAHA